MTPSEPSNVQPEVEAAERWRQHLEEIARERDRAYRALQEREAELARIQRIARVGGLEIDFRDGVKNRRSPEYLLVHGLPSGAANETYEDWVKRIHPEDRAQTVKHLFEVLKGRSEDYSDEYRIVRPSDGETRWIRVVAKIERDRDGRALRLIGADLDITDQMLARVTLRESEERFRQVAGESSLKPFVLEARYRRADGEWRWLRSESQPRWDPTGKHIGFIGVAHDITAAKQAESELRRLNETLELRIRERTSQLESSEAQMRAILETSNQYQALLNRYGDVLYANKTALAGIHAEAGDVVGRPFWETPWFAATDGMRNAVRNAFMAVLKGEGVRTEM